MGCVTSVTPSLIEPIPIKDDYIQGIAKIEAVGPCARFTLFSEQSLTEADEEMVRVVVRKIVVPIEALPSLIHQAVCFLAGQTLTRISNVISMRPNHH